ncbi:MAG: SdrD B-like domain-containing protein, partial [Candidatus Nanopelagicales bacterium]
GQGARYQASPTGYTWVNAQINPSSITIQSGVTTTVTATNWLAPLPTPPTGVLTLTKTISGSGSGPFSLGITGPNGYTTNTTIDGGQTKVITGLVSGIYTVTETSPGAGWTTLYTATAGYSTGSSAVVTMTNANNTPLVPAGTITGTVYRDFNSDGMLTANGTITETGVAGIAITALDRNGANCGSVTSDVNGGYVLSPTCSGPWNLLFSALPEGYEPSVHGDQNASNLQFVATSTATNVNFGINRPCDYCQDNPAAATTVFVNGAITNSLVTTLSVAVAFPYDVPDVYGSNLFGQNVDQLTAGQAGSVWGIGWQPTTRMLYLGAAAHRHADFGPQGPAGIYALQRSQNGTATLAWSLNLATLGVNAGTEPAGRDINAYTSPSLDSQMFGVAGKLALGDLEIGTDNNTLWAVNVADGNQALVRMNVSNGAQPASATQFPLVMGNNGIPTCKNGQFRPWALAMNLGNGYLGGVCDASNSGVRSDLVAYVLSFAPENPASGFSTVLTASLAYTKGDAIVNDAVVFAITDTTNIWYPWTDSYSDASFNAYTAGGVTRVSRPQPLLSDIEFDASGAMILGLTDRGALQLGGYNYRPTSNASLIGYASGGDILRACKNISGAYVLESNSVCGGITGSRGIGNQANTGVGGGEFYGRDLFATTAYSLGVVHGETALGSLTQIPGYRDVMLTAYDVLPDQGPGQGFFNEGGVLRFSNQNGERIGRYEVYSGSETSTGRFGKAGGMGDLQALCDPAPLEIGNRVWNDLNNNGIQDAGEPGIGSLQVNIQSPTATFTTTTDLEGRWYFLATPNTHYTLTVTPPNAMSLTVPNAAALSGATVSNHAISDTIDSDAVLVAGVATIYYTTGNAGQNNHGLDFGFTPPANGQVDILNITPPATLQIVKQVTGGTSSSPFTVTVSGPNGYSVITTVTASSARLITGLTAGTYTVTESSLPAAPSGFVWGTATYTPTNGAITLSYGTTGIVTITNPLTPTLTPTLHINKVATPTTVRAGDLVTYTITLTNDGPGVGSNITVRDVLPAEVTYISSTATSGAYSSSTARMGHPDSADR